MFPSDGQRSITGEIASLEKISRGSLSHYDASSDSTLQPYPVQEHSISSTDDMLSFEAPRRGTALDEQSAFDRHYGYPVPAPVLDGSQHRRQRYTTNPHASPPALSPYAPPAPRPRLGAPRNAVSCDQIPIGGFEESSASSHASPGLSQTRSPARSPLRQKEAGKHRIAHLRRGSESDLSSLNSRSTPQPAPLPSRGSPHSRSIDFSARPDGDRKPSPTRSRQAARIPRVPSVNAIAPKPRRTPNLSLDERAFVSAALTPRRGAGNGGGSSRPVDPADCYLSPTALAASPAEQTSPYGAAMDVLASARQLMEECRANGIQWELNDWEGPAEGPSAPLEGAEVRGSAAASPGLRKAKERVPQSANSGMGVAERANADGPNPTPGRGRKAARQRPVRGQVVGGGRGGCVGNHHRMASVDELLTPRGGGPKRAVNGGGGGGGARSKGGLSTKMGGAVGGIDVRFFQEFDDLPRELLLEMLASNADGLGVSGQKHGQQNKACFDVLADSRMNEARLPRVSSQVGKGFPKVQNEKAEDRDLYDLQFEDGGAETKEVVATEHTGNRAEILVELSKLLRQNRDETTGSSLEWGKSTAAHFASSPVASPLHTSGARTPPFNVPLPRKRRESAQFPSCASVPSFHTASSPLSSAKEREARLPPAVPRATPKPSAPRSGPMALDRFANSSASPNSHDHAHALTLGHTRGDVACEPVGAVAGVKVRQPQPQLAQQQQRRERKHNSGSQFDLFSGFAANHSRSSSASSPAAGGSGNCMQWGAVEAALMACFESGSELSGAALAGALPNLKPTEFVLRRPYEDIKGRYSLGNKEIGEGRFGTIRTCLERATGQVYACKTILKKSIETIEDADDVRREVTFLAMLKGHPSMVTLQEVFEDDKAIHLVMELCAGGDLFDRIKSLGHLPEADAAQILKQLLEALIHCRSLGILHRDIKPENILLCSPNDNVPIKLIDFGVATVLEEGAMCRETAGTPEYMAPEVLDECYNYEADVWGAGVTLYVMLSGVPPFWESSNRPLEEAIRRKKVVFKYWKWASVSDEAKDLITRMLEKDPLDRITAREVLAHPWIQKHTNAAKQ